MRKLYFYMSRIIYWVYEWKWKSETVELLCAKVTSHLNERKCLMCSISLKKKKSWKTHKLIIGAADWSAAVTSVWHHQLAVRILIQWWEHFKRYSETISAQTIRMSCAVLYPVQKMIRVLKWDVFYFSYTTAVCHTAHFIYKPFSLLFTESY